MSEVIMIVRFFLYISVDRFDFLLRDRFFLITKSAANPVVGRRWGHLYKCYLYVMDLHFIAFSV